MAGEIRSLEHPTLKVPYELLNKKFRAAQKSIDRDIASVSSSTRELNAQTERGEDMAVEEVVKTLDVVSQKLASLKRRAGDALSEEERHLDQLTTRVSYLKSFASRDMSDVAQRVWKRQRLDRVLTDHLFRTGHYRTALALARGSDLGPLVDTDLYRMAQKIEDALLQHDTSPCLAWCAENKSKLKKIRSCLEFRVRVQDFIEMIKADKRMEAIRYARKYLSNVEPELIAEFQEAMALLAFSLDTKCMKYRKLFSDERWKELVELFRSENFAMHQLNHHSMLSATLQAGLSALKTPQCYSSESYNLQCPVCSKVFNKLADPLPFSHHAQSQLICAMSGEPINEHNPPMALPNGYIYGENALQKMAEENEGRITCLHTHEVFSIDAARKVFVM